MNKVVVTLSERWRVVNDQLQWILELRKGRKTGKSTGWQGMRFCQQRTTLTRDIGELCGDVDQAALALIDALPDQHPSCGGSSNHPSCRQSNE